MDIYDQATERETQDRDAAIQRHREEVARRRPGRVHCQDCGEMIPVERRLANPTARTCIDCGSAADLRLRVFSRPRC